MLARADEGSGSPEDVDLTDIVRSLGRRLGAVCGRLHIVLVARVDGAASARATRERLDQVLDNLIETRSSTHPTGATVTVTCSGCELHVVDEEPGLSDAERERRSTASAGRPRRRSGLGFPIPRAGLLKLMPEQATLRPATAAGIDGAVIFSGN